MKRSFSVMNEENISISKNEVINPMNPKEINSSSANIVEDKDKEYNIYEAQDNFASKKMMMTRNKEAIKTYCRIRAIENDPGKK